jgi:hypothetical protein
MRETTFKKHLNYLEELKSDTKNPYNPILKTQPIIFP